MALSVRSLLSRPVIQSLLFHMAVIVLGMVSWPFLHDRDISAQPLITVDVVRTLPQTNLAASSKAKSSPEPEQEATRKRPPPPPPPPPPTAARAPAPQPPAPKPVPPKPQIQTAEILPEKPVPVPEAKPKPSAPQPVSVATPVSRPKRAPEPAPQPPKPAPESRPAEPVKQLAKPAPATRPNKLIKQQQQKKRAEAMNGLLQNLAEASLAKKAEENQKAQQKQDKLAMANQLSAAVGDAIRAPESSSVLPLGISEIDRLLNHIAKCFVLPPGAAEAIAEQIVDVDLEMRQDGTVAKITIVESARLNSDKNFRIVAQAARRAVLDCQPLPLPADKYESWKVLPLGFNSTFMQRGTL